MKRWCVCVALLVLAVLSLAPYLPLPGPWTFAVGQEKRTDDDAQAAAAAEAFERCIQRKPTRADLLEAFQALGRVHQRAQRTEQALAIWARLEKLFPDDARVQEQIATTLAEEGQNEQALQRYEAL